MVRHLVMYKLTDKSNEKKLCEMFGTMKANIDILKEVSANIDYLKEGRSFDVILDIVVESKEDLITYKNHPYHAEIVKPFVHSIIEKSVCVDYEF